MQLLIYLVMYVVLIPKLACEPEICMEKESSELLAEFRRTSDYEEAGHQTADVQGRSLTVLIFGNNNYRPHPQLLNKGTSYHCFFTRTIRTGKSQIALKNRLCK